MLLTKLFLEVWGEGGSWEELQAAVEAYPAAAKAPWLAPDLTFKVVVDSFGHTISMDQQLDYIQALEFIPFQGRVRLRDPDVCFLLLEVDCGDTRAIIDADVPKRFYFGRVVARSDRSILDAYTLKRRAYLGPTSMDTEMALVMSNMAQVRPSSFVLDPYAGTGSCMVAAAAHGARVVGGDIDIKVIREGKVGPGGQRVTLASNFEQYGLPAPVGLLRMDCHCHPLRPGLEEVFHAIIGDPPYGVRAGGRKSGARPGSTLPPITDRATHIPATQPYTLGECLRDLLSLSARLLTVGGRLVYFLPATPETYAEVDIPAHPALELVANSEQILTTRYSRRLITMTKARPFDATAEAAHHAARPDPTLPIDRLHDIVYEVYDKDEAADKPSTARRCRSKQF